MFLFLETDGRNIYITQLLLYAMEKTIVQTVVKDYTDFQVLEVCDEIGNEWATNITYNIAECKHCDYVQHCNSGDIIKHIEIWHNDK